MERKDLISIVEKTGTPVYVYEEETIQNNFQILEEAFSGFKADIHYAMKANENLAIIKIIKKLGGGIDAVSLNEIKRALELGFSPDRIVFTPSFPDDEEIDFAVKQSVKVHVGDTYLLDYFLNKFPEFSIGLRLNSETSIEGNQKIATAHSGSKFGIPLTDLPYIFSLMDKGLKINTLHIHTGSDIKKWTDLARSADVLFKLLKDFPQVTRLDLGSGFKVKYSEKSPEIDLQAYSRYITEKIAQSGRDLTIIFEPGKFLVSNAGYFLMRVNGVKKGYEKNFAGVNSGFHHFLRPMYYEAYHEIINLSNPHGKHKEYDIVGQLCEEDTFAYDRKLPEIRKGDILAIKNAGAYAFSMSSNYNLRDKPKEYLWKNNSLKDITRIIHRI